MPLSIIFLYLLCIVLVILFLCLRDMYYRYLFCKHVLPHFRPQADSYKSACADKFAKNVEAKKRELQKRALAKMSKNEKQKYAKALRKFKPQVGVLSPLYLKLSSHVTEKLSDQMLDKVEGLIALYFALAECVSKKQFISVAVLYAKTHCSRSLVGYISVIADDLFKDMTPQGSKTPEWLNLMTTSLTNWKLVCCNPGFKKVSRVLSMMVTLGIFTKDLSCNVKGVEIFAIGAMEKQLTAVDLIDAVIETVVFFAEGAYRCFDEGSFNPLLYNTSAMAKTEKRYVEMLSLWEYARNGNLSRFASISESEFDANLAKLVRDLEEMYKQASPGIEKKVLCDRWREMAKIQTEFESSRVRGGLRMAPYCFKVFGESSVGKSTFTDVVMSTILKANKFPSGDDYIITLNPDDKHMSNMRSYVTGIKIDDYGNSKLDFVDIAPSDWLVQLCNNIKRYAIMADLANKGKVSLEPACVSITTNVEDLLAHQVSNEPISIGRRAHVHVDIKVKEEFRLVNEEGQLTHMLDPNKVFERYGESTEIQDLWLVTVRLMRVIPSQMQGKRVPPTFEFENLEGMTNVSIFKFLEYALIKSKKHFAVQDALVKQQTNLTDKIPWCKNCNQPSQVCKCTPTLTSGTDSQTPFEPHFGIQLAHTMKKYTDKWSLTAERKTRFFASNIEDITNKQLIKMLSWFETSKFAVWTNYVPDELIENSWMRGLVMFFNEDIINVRIKEAVRNYWAATGLVVGFIAMFSIALAVITCLFMSLASIILCYNCRKCEGGLLLRSKKAS